MKILSLTFLCCGFLLNAQELSTAIQNGVKEAVPSVSNEEFMEEIHTELVYPGCEFLIEQGNEALKNCFHEKIRKEIHDGLTVYANDPELLGDDQVRSTVKFVVNKEGEISDIKIVASHSEYRKIMNEVMVKIASKSKNIQPAKLENGQAVKSLFRVPVTFVFSTE